MSNYAVTLNYNCHYGYVEYNEADKTAVVTLPEAVAEAKAASTIEKGKLKPKTKYITINTTIYIHNIYLFVSFEQSHP